MQPPPIPENEQARLEALRDAVALALELPDLGAAPIPVTLSEVVDQAEPSATDGQIRGVYRSDDLD